MKLLEEQIKNIIAEECKCPICGGRNIEYGVSELDCNTLFYPCECEDCGATFEETYKLEFVGHYNIQDSDNEIEFIGV